MTREEHGEKHYQMFAVEYCMLRCVRENCCTESSSKRHFHRQVLRAGKQKPVTKVTAQQQSHLDPISSYSFLHTQHTPFPHLHRHRWGPRRVGKEPLQTSSQESSARKLPFTRPVPHCFPGAVSRTQVVLSSGSTVKSSEGSLWNKSFGIWVTRDAQTAHQTLCNQ